METVRTLLDELLEEQQRMTPVERFAARESAVLESSQQRYYRELIPRGVPGEGEQYAFAVDMDRCTGCKACVSACHSLNGLDEGESWRDTGLLVGHGEAGAYQQTITGACHHCLEPACALGCPVKAYEKDRATGIVRHLDDQCIGCQYCVLKCPYDVPKYSPSRGIVRKCDMCWGRLGAGEAPACVQACPTGAITIRVVRAQEVRESLKVEDVLLPGVIVSEYTKPTTIYSTRKPMPEDARASDAGGGRLEPAHWPLIWMLVCTQMGAGIFCGAAVLAIFSKGLLGELGGVLTWAGAGVLSAGLVASVFHLGRPLGAWKCFLGWRTSWMSREVLMFGAFAGTAALASAGDVRGTLDRMGFVWSGVPQFPAQLRDALMVLSALSGVLAVFCSAMIYVDTRRVWWRASVTAIRFGGTLVVLGASSLALVFAFFSAEGSVAAAQAAVCAGGIAIGVRAVSFGWEWVWMARAENFPEAKDHLSVKKMRAGCGGVMGWRGVAVVGATMCDLVGLVWGGRWAWQAAACGLLLTFVNQLLERYLYFVAVVPHRMPGFVVARSETGRV